ncbi:hypothetical protein [[Acholeplasma] multilocale]|uniref:hypothetical protein n=1 Tax=[Acholeplasma] multilocale TaxID=264638 RepID=UPI00047EACDD|nr:hypothetical protein [[Acholeplasma] multilocale]
MDIVTVLPELIESAGAVIKIVYEAVEFFSKNKNKISKKNSKLLLNWIEEQKIIERIKAVEILDVDKAQNISASIGQYMFNIYLDPYLNLKKDIIRYDFDNFIENIEHISFYNQITSKDIVFLKNIVKTRDRLLVIKEEFIEAYKTKMTDDSKVRFEKTINSHYPDLLKSGFHEIKVISYKNIEYKNSSFANPSVIFQETEVERMNGHFDLPLDKKYTIVDFNDVTIDLEYHDYIEDSEEIIFRLEFSGLIKTASYGATFGPAKNSYFYLTNKGLKFLEFIYGKTFY